MIFMKALVMGWRSLGSHRLRSTLTALAVTLGVASVVLTVGISNGVGIYCDEYYAGFATQITLSPASPTGTGPARELRESDAAALASDPRTPDVTSALPVLNGTSVARYAGRFVGAQVIASKPEYLCLGHRELADGSMFTARQVRDGAQGRAVRVSPANNASTTSGPIASPREPGLRPVASASEAR
jgi:hypothetical protein